MAMLPVMASESPIYLLCQSEFVVFSFSVPLVPPHDLLVLHLRLRNVRSQAGSRFHLVIAMMDVEEEVPIDSRLDQNACPTNSSMRDANEDYN